MEWPFASRCPKNDQGGEADSMFRLANLALPPPGIKYKASSMPFQQMENISHFLRACEMPPLNLPSHDRFLTVDLYDAKDPAQVVQCIGSFSRAANTVNAGRFPRPIGPRRAASPTKKASRIDAVSGSTGSMSRARAVSNTSQGSEQAHSSKSPSAGVSRVMSPSLTGGSNSSKATNTTSTTNGSIRQAKSNVSSWSKKTDEGQTAPAWNIAQYGYMGGASQGNQGIMFGAPRQITSTGVSVPSLAEKERRRKEQEIQEEAARIQEQEDGRRKQARRDKEEQQARFDEERRWEEETRKARERERQEVERQKHQWEEEERRWKEEEERRQREDRIAGDPATNGFSLRGQFLSHYQAEQNERPSKPPSSQATFKPKPTQQASEGERIKELERQLEEAKERERRYEREREEQRRGEKTADSPATTQSYRQEQSPLSQSEVENSFASEDQNRADEQRTTEEEKIPPKPQQVTRPLPNPQSSITRPTKPLDPPQAEPQPAAPPRASADPPEPAVASSTYTSTRPVQNRTDRFLASNPAPEAPKPQSHYPTEIGVTSSSERAAEDARRVARQARTKAGGWASKSLLEREMERERERQREWEEAQMKRTKNAGPGAEARVIGPRAMR